MALADGIKIPRSAEILKIGRVVWVVQVRPM